MLRVSVLAMLVLVGAVPSPMAEHGRQLGAHHLDGYPTTSEPDSFPKHMEKSVVRKAMENDQLHKKPEYPDILGDVMRAEYEDPPPTDDCHQCVGKGAGCICPL